MQNSMENFGSVATAEKLSDIERLLSLVPEAVEDADYKKQENLLDGEMAKFSEEELIALAAEVQAKIGEMSSSFADEHSYYRLSILYGAACSRLEELESGK